jgi:hypothetical protein
MLQPRYRLSALPDKNIPSVLDVARGAAEIRPVMTARAI